MTRRLFVGGLLGAITASATGLLSLLSEPAEEAPGGGDLIDEDDTALIDEDDTDLIDE